ncbi:PREDICTED: transposon, partial [Prunus dulcis]
IEGMTKDTIKAHLDLERMGIQRGLWMNRDSDRARRDLAFFSMKSNDKKELLKFVSSIKFPDGYASNTTRCMNVDRSKFARLKSHDCHVFMQRLLSVGIRHLLLKDVVKPIMLLSRFFPQLTAKFFQKTDIYQSHYDIVQLLCKFDMIFPPAFFTSMIHVMVHLPEKALLAGLVNYRWMYLIE